MYRLLQMGKINVKIFISYINAHRKVTSVKNDINNQVDSIIHSVDTNQPLSPATPVITQWADAQSGHIAKDKGYAWVHQHGLLFTKVDLAMTDLPPVSTQSASSRDQHCIPDMAPFPL